MRRLSMLITTFVTLITGVSFWVLYGSHLSFFITVKVDNSDPILYEKDELPLIFNLVITVFGMMITWIITYLAIKNITACFFGNKKR